MRTVSREFVASPAGLAGLAGLLVAMAFIAAFGSHAGAAPFSLSYGGQLTDAAGAPVPGPVALELRFYRTASGGSPVGGVSAQSFASVPLTEGVFQVELTLTAAELAILFDGTNDAWIEVKDTESGVTYPRQRFSAVPYAFKVPVDGSTVGYNADGELEVKPTAASGTTIVTAINASGGTIDAGRLPSLAGDVTGAPAGTTVAKLQGRTVSSTAPTAGQVLSWNSGASRWEPTAPGVGGTVTSVTAGTGLTSGGSPITTSGTLSIATAGVSDVHVAAGIGAAKIADGTVSDTEFQYLSGVTSNIQDQLDAKLSSESDPQVGTLSASGWCAANPGGTAIDCNQSPPFNALQSSAIYFGTSLTNSVAIKTNSVVRLTVDGGTGKVTVNAPLAIQETGASPAFYTTFQGGDQSANISYTLPPSPPGADGDVLSGTTAGVLTWVPPPSAPVISVNSYTGTVNLTAADVGAVATTAVGAASGIASLDPGSKVVQNPASAQTTSGAGKIPLGDTGGPLSLSWLPAILTGKDADTVDSIDGASIVTLSGTQALTNKTFDADSNTVSNIDDGNIKLAAAIGRTKLANGAANQVVVNDGAGAMTSIATLDVSRGGTGATSAPSARSALSAAQSGVNADISALLSGNIGIGTSAPNTLLHVAAGGADSMVQLTNSATGSLSSDGGYVGFPSGVLDMVVKNKENANLLLFTNSLERVRIDGGGNVGIGTNAPTAPLHVAVQGGPAYVVAQSAAGPTAAFVAKKSQGTLAAPTAVANNELIAVFKGEGFAPSSTWASASAAVEVQVDGTPTGSIVPGRLSMKTQDSGGTLIERMVINNAGDVGIGVNPPKARLDVNGSVKMGFISSSGNYTVQSNDTVIHISGLAASATITLPTGACAANVDGGRIVVVTKGADPYSVSFTGAAVSVSAMSASVVGSRTFICAGAGGWIPIASY